MKLLKSEYSNFRRDLQEYLKNEILNHPTTILDPMAGTSPLIPFFEKEGYSAFLYDILPLHYFINKIKKYSAYSCYSELGRERFSKNFKKIMEPLQNKKLIISDKWIDDNVLKFLVKAWSTTNAYNNNEADILRAMILLSIRYFSSCTESGNPSWNKIGGISTKYGLDIITDKIINGIEKYYKYSYNGFNSSPKGDCQIGIKNATTLKLQKPVEIVLTSPPYCNRLNYVVLYGPELYFLEKVGYPINTEHIVGHYKLNKDFDYQRNRLYLIKKSQYLTKLLKKIENKPKKDSRYYLKCYIKYFDSIFRTFENVLTLLSSEGVMYIVVQDNIHRGEEIRINKALEDLFKSKNYKVEIDKTWDRHHLGLRNVSKDSKFIKRRHEEKLLKVVK